MLKTTLAIVAGALAGAAIGASGILCPDGSCAITGSWYGTGAVGAALGLAISNFSKPAPQPQSPPQDPPPPPSPPNPPDPA